MLVCTENGKILQKIDRRSWFSSTWLCVKNRREMKISRKLCVGSTVVISAYNCVENAKKTGVT